MDKLELKYIAPYLPYKLSIQHGDKSKVMNMGKGSSVYWIGISAVIDWYNSEMLSKPKPILRPMSDFWDTSKSWMQQVRDIDNSIEFWSGEFDNPCHLPYVCFELLIRNHFDVFDLIGQGLAIDINTLKEETT